MADGVMYMADTKQFLERFNRWKNGAPIQELYKAGRPVKFDEGKDINEGPKEDPALRASLEYALALKLDRYNEGKDTEEPKAVVGEYNFNAIHKVAQNAPLSYGSYYDLTGDVNMDNRLPKYDTGKQDYTQTTYDMLREFGFDHNSALGVLANAMQESSMNPDIVSKTKNYHGLLQNSTDIKNAVIGLYGDYSLRSQLKLVSDWAEADEKITKGKYSPYVSTYAGKYKKSGYKTPEEATYAFMKYYERPVILDKNNKVVGYQHQDKRINYATTLAKSIKDPLEYIERPNEQPVQVPEYKFEAGPKLDMIQIPENPSFNMTLNNAQYNNRVSSYLNKDAGTATWPRHIALPTIFDMFNSIHNNELPLKQPLNQWIAQ